MAATRPLAQVLSHRHLCPASGHNRLPAPERAAPASGDPRCTSQQLGEPRSPSSALVPRGWRSRLSARPLPGAAGRCPTLSWSIVRASPPTGRAPPGTPTAASGSAPHPRRTSASPTRTPGVRPRSGSARRWGAGHGRATLSTRRASPTGSTGGGLCPPTASGASICAGSPRRSRPSRSWPRWTASTSPAAAGASPPARPRAAGSTWTATAWSSPALDRPCACPASPTTTRASSTAAPSGPARTR
jgi:hypothetical protein